MKNLLMNSPVIFGHGQHEPGSFHADVDGLQAEVERVRELHGRRHLLVHFAAVGHLNQHNNNNNNDNDVNRSAYKTRDGNNFQMNCSGGRTQSDGP